MYVLVLVLNQIILPLQGLPIPIANSSSSSSYSKEEMMACVVVVTVGTRSTITIFNP